MKHNYILLLLAILISGCDSCKTNKKQQEAEQRKKAIIINHYNITIAADLSNRLNTKFHPKAVSDTSIVNLIIDNIYPRILRHQREVNQLDQFRIDFINKKQVTAYDVHTKSLEIDFKRFGNRQEERIDYLRKDFNKDTALFKNEFKRINEKAIKEPHGSDIWTYLNQGVDEMIVDTTKTHTSYDGHQFLNQQKNVLILLTDGYIESGIYKKGYDLSGDKIKQFRDAYQKSGKTDINKFYRDHPEFSIKTLINPLLKDLEVLVLEMYDRTETNGGASIQPTDMEIMKIFWNDWLKRSGVKRKELHPIFSNKAEAGKVIMKFLGI